MRQKVLFMTVGPPGCGKTTWAQNQVKNHGGIHISRDEIRFKLLDENDEYFDKEELVFWEMIQQITDAFSNIDYVYADATHLNWGSRRKLLYSLFLDNDVKICPVYFTTDLKTCLDRNSLRQGLKRVPEETIKDMYAKMTHPITDEFAYDLIFEI